MPAMSTLLLFAAAAILLLVVPGPSVLFVVTRSIDQGRRAGLVSVLGGHTGSLVHVAAAAFGLSALIVSSALAFTAIKYVGAAYLVWLAIRRWRAGDAPIHTLGATPQPLGRLYRQGILVAVLNPKTAIFFLAFLPQFVDRERGTVTVQVLVLGAVFILLGLITDSVYALVAAVIGTALRRSRKARRAERYVSSGVYLGLGVTTAVAGGHASASA